MIIISAMIANTKKKGVHVSQGPHLIAKLVVNERKAKKKEKIVQFVIIFHLLKDGRPMTNFEHMKGLFDFLKVHHIANKHSK